MKFLGYILRSARRNPIRSLLTISSIAVCGLLAMTLLSYFAVNDEIRKAVAPYNQAITMGAQGFGQMVPIALLREIPAIDERSGIQALIRRESDEKPLISPYSWFGGKFRGEATTTFAQFAVEPDTIFDIEPELSIPADQLQKFRENLDGVVIGRKLATEKKLGLGDPFELKGEIYPVDLNLTVAGIYDGPAKSDLRSCFFNWYFLREKLRAANLETAADNAGTLIMRCNSGSKIPALAEAIDADTRNSDHATKTQTLDAFIGQFSEMSADLQSFINMIGLAVAFALLVICGVSMSMSMRERTGEVAVLRAIGFRKHQILFLVLAEAVLIAGLGGLVGAFGTKLLFELWDISPYTMGFLPYFHVPTEYALLGLGVALLVGLLSGLIPAINAARLSVVDGLRKVV